MGSVNHSCIDPGYRSDHSLPKIIKKFKKGKGLWKFNNSLLHDADYLNTINNCIDTVKKQYCIPVYDIENLNNIQDYDLQFVINDQLFLETLLIEIRGKTISYSSYKKKQLNICEDNLKKTN